jgi:diguanylate cyclase (GGDEF)-like protein/PAS domain S-box-containing protein
MQDSGRSRDSSAEQQDGIVHRRGAGDRWHDNNVEPSAAACTPASIRAPKDLDERDGLAPGRNELNSMLEQIAALRLHEEEALLHPESGYRMLLENAECAMVVLDENFTVSHANPRFEQLTGYTRNEVEGKQTWMHAIAPEDLERMRRYHLLRKARSSEVPEGYAFRMVDKEGSSRDIYASVALIPGTTTTLASLWDITEGTSTARELRKFSAAVESVSDWVLITDGKGVIEYANHAVESISGYRREELIGQTPRIFKSGTHDPAFYAKLWETLRTGNLFQAVMVDRKKNGELFEIFHTITPLRDAQGDIRYFIATSRDQTQQRRLEERVNYLAYYDSLTGLPNGELFLDRLTKELSRAEYQKRIVAVIAVEIERLASIRETLGKEAGDEVLREAGRRLSQAVREGDTVARLGRDKFGILLVDIAQSDDIIIVVNKVLTGLFPAFSVAGASVSMTASIGASFAPQDASDAAALVKNAEIALVKAREQGQNTYQFFTGEMNRKATMIALMQKSLSHALSNKEFVLYYQPYFNIDTRNMAGMEALMRWDSPDHGFVLPGRFIPVLEETQMINEVGFWAVQEVCRQIKAWHERGYQLVPITTNISAIQFRHQDLGDALIAMLKESKIDARYFAIELTESALLHNPERIRALLVRLKDLGATVSIDDFGTGYSSISYLKKLPADNLKIDLSFIRDIASNADDGAIVSSIVSLAHNLRLKTIAEGVETEEQLKILRVLQCDMAQGYYFSKPVPAGTAETMLKKRG